MPPFDPRSGTYSLNRSTESKRLANGLRFCPRAVRESWREVVFFRLCRGIIGFGFIGIVCPNSCVSVKLVARKGEQTGHSSYNMQDREPPRKFLYSTASNSNILRVVCIGAICSREKFLTQSQSNNFQPMGQPRRH